MGINNDLPPLINDALDTAPFGFCLLNTKTQALEYLNYAFAPMLGSFGVANPGDPIADYFPETALQYLTHQTQRSYDYDCEVVNDAGQSRWVRLHVEEMNYKSTSYRAIWINDITTIVQSEEQYIKSLKATEEVAEMKSNLLATMSHEIRTPMQSVFGFLELIAEEKPDQKIMDMVSVARSSAADLLDILDSVLDLAKLDADKMELDHFEVPLRTLSYSILEALEVKKFGDSVELRTDIAQDVPFVVTGDPKRLRQILVNLMGNALKFTQEGHITLSINRNIHHIELKDDLIGLRFEVSDTGIGMSEEVASRLFHRFTQADNSTARKFGGTGLGLSISKKLVELMSGQIGVESQEGHGSTFWFEIPVREVSIDQMPDDLPDLEGVAVLVVEDHPKAVVEISNSLRSMGADVDAVENCTEGLALIKRRPYDCVVSDNNLPDGYGIHLLQQVSDLRPYCGLVMYTVHDDYAIKNALRSLGATHLIKPASRLGLGEAVQGVIKQISAHKIEGPQKILIAEDTEAVRTILDKQLKVLGVQADFVEDGRQALEAVATGEYGILFTDLHMPDVDGYAVIRNIRTMEAEGNRFPVVVITADVQMAQRQTYMELGFDECLLKPITLAQVKRLMMRWGLLPDILPQAEEAEEADTEVPTPDSLDTDKSINLMELKNILGVLDDTAIDMLQMFVQMTEPLIEEMKTTYEAKNWTHMAEIGHSLKGSARSVGAMTLGNLCADIQDHAVTADDNKRLKIMTAVLTEFDQVKAEIKTYQDTGF